MFFDMFFSMEAVEELADILNTLNVLELVTPTNLADVKRDWLSRSEFTNPTFCYDKKLLYGVSAKAEPLREAAALISDTMYVDTELDRILYSILRRRILDAWATIDLANAIANGDDSSARDAVISRFGCPDSRVLSKVDIALRSGKGIGALAPNFQPTWFPLTNGKRRYLEGMTFNAREIADNFQFILDYNGIKGWKIRLDSNCAAIDVREKNNRGEKEIVIPSDRKVNGLKLVELAGHEIDTHLRGFENAYYFFDEILPPELKPLTPIFAKSGDARMNEGVAKISDWQISGDAALPSLDYCEAIHLARFSGKSFAEVAEEIYQLKRERKVKPESARRGAWNITYRIFRGISDSKNPAAYAFTKDSAYLMGWLDLAWLLASDGVSVSERNAIFDFCSLNREEIADLRKVFPTLTPKYRRSAASDVVNFLLI